MSARQIVIVCTKQGRTRTLEECPNCSRPMFEGCDCNEPQEHAGSGPTTGMATLRQGNSLVVQGYSPAHNYMPAQMPLGAAVVASPYSLPAPFYCV